MTRILGAVLAGGQARRFGGDKALAMLDGTPLIERAIASLAPYCDAIVVVGRPHAPVPTVADLPGPDLGPLGGIAGGLAHGAAHGFDAVLTTACDTPSLPHTLVAALRQAACGHAAEAPTVGLWPTALAQPLLDHLATATNRSVRAWAQQVGAVAVLPGLVLANVNTPADLAALAERADHPSQSRPNATSSCGGSNRSSPDPG